MGNPFRHSMVSKIRWELGMVDRYGEREELLVGSAGSCVQTGAVTSWKGLLNVVGRQQGRREVGHQKRGSGTDTLRVPWATQERRD